MIGKIFSRCILAAAVFMTAAAMMYAQPQHNDTLRTKTWSIYVQGGVGGFHGMRGPEGQYDRDTRYLAPVVDFGFMYYPRPWLRFGLDAGYTYLQSADHGVLSRSTSYPSTTIAGYTGTLTVDEARIQNQNFTQTAATDLTLGINFLEIWRERQNQWFNLWLSVGAGYMHGWNRYTTSWAIDENMIIDELPVYSHSYIKSDGVDNQFDTFYVPFGCSIEFDVIPQLSLGLFGTYKYFPLNIDHTPTGMWSAGLAIRYNIVGRKQGLKTKKDKIDALQASLAQAEQDKAALSSEVDKLKKEVEDTKAAVAVVPAVVPAVIPAPLVEVDKPLGDFAVQIYAFKRYQHAPNDAIFYGDNPTIYRNGKLRRYVIFTQTLEEAQKKLAEVQSRYHDAFIVTIDKYGTVKPYK